MKINIHGKVVSCNDIGSSVKRYLCVKTKQQPLSFLPFEVQKVEVPPRKPSLAQYKKSLMTVIHRNRTPASRYEKTSRKTQRTPRTTNSNTRIRLQLNDSTHRQEALLHSFYAHSLLGDKRAQTAEFSRLKKPNLQLSNQASYHNARVSAFEETDPQEKDRLLPNTENRTRRTMDRLDSVLGALTHRTCRGFQHKRRSAIGSRETLKFAHNPFTNLFEFSYTSKSPAADEGTGAIA